MTLLHILQPLLTYQHFEKYTPWHSVRERERERELAKRQPKLKRKKKEV
jgi:hypothetical protein